MHRYVYTLHKPQISETKWKVEWNFEAQINDLTMKLVLG